MKDKNRSPLTNPLWLGFMGIALGLVLALAAYGVGRALRTPLVLRGAMLNPPVPAVDFSLQGANGQTYTLYEFRGTPVLLSFTCSTCSRSSIVMSKLTQAKHTAFSDGLDVQVIVISLEPEQEQPNSFDAYVKRFDADFIGLSGAMRDITDIAHSYDVFFESSQNTVESTPLIFLIDKVGYWRAVYPMSLSADDIVADLHILMKEN